MKSYKIILLFVFSFLILGIIVDLFFSPASRIKPRKLPPVQPKQKVRNYIIIHLTGRVENPGVYRLVQGTRLYQAIERAGGLLSDADQDAVNLARTLKDGEKIFIPAKKMSLGIGKTPPQHYLIEPLEIVELE